jgi:hypothetical protein
VEDAGRNDHDVDGAAGGGDVRGRRTDRPVGSDVDRKRPDACRWCRRGAPAARKHAPDCRVIRECRDERLADAAACADDDSGELAAEVLQRR